MNKQKLIDKQALIDELMKIPGVGSNSDALETIKRFPSYEPKKLVVPKFVADWIELCKEKADLISCLSGSYEYGVNQFEADHQELVARAWLYGYEVEKEPLYSVIIAGEYLVKEISCSNEVKLVSTAYLPQYLAHHYQLTEKQIKEIDERFWPFAVPVEEVVER